jgi:hypothetical protein
MTAVSRLIPPYNPPGAPEPEAVLDVMQRELRRSLDGMVVPGSPAPVFHALQPAPGARPPPAGRPRRPAQVAGADPRAHLRRRPGRQPQVRQRHRRRPRRARRGPREQRLDRRPRRSEPPGPPDRPVEADPDQVRRGPRGLLRPQEGDPERVPARRGQRPDRERPVVHREPLHHDDFPRAAWERVLVDLSRRFLQHPEIYDPGISLSAERSTAGSPPARAPRSSPRTCTSRSASRAGSSPTTASTSRARASSICARSRRSRTGPRSSACSTRSSPSSPPCAPPRAPAPSSARPCSRARPPAPCSTRPSATASRASG